MLRTRKTWQAWERKAILDHYGNRCLVPNCTDTDLCLDHVIPFVLNGDDDVANMQVLCRSHNLSKYNQIKDYRDPDNILTSITRPPIDRSKWKKPGREPSGNTNKIVLYLEDDLLERVDAAAKQDNRTRPAWLRVFLQEVVS